MNRLSFFYITSVIAIICLSGSTVTSYDMSNRSPIGCPLTVDVTLSGNDMDSNTSPVVGACTDASTFMRHNISDGLANFRWYEVDPSGMQTEVHATFCGTSGCNNSGFQGSVDSDNKLRVVAWSTMTGTAGNRTNLD